MPAFANSQAAAEKAACHPFSAGPIESSMGQVHQITDATALEAAWNAYADHMARASAEPRLLLDREWVEQRAILNRRFDRLYLMQERGR